MIKKTFKPLGARLLVQDIITTLSLEERARNAGLEIIIEQENRPRPTQGRVIALGDDPILHVNIKIGDVVFFSPHAGSLVTLQDQMFRQLDYQEVTAVESECTVEESQSPPQSEVQPAEHESGSRSEPV